MPDASISSTESTFGTISGTFTADQSTISGTVYAVTGTVDGSVGVPGPQGQPGPQGPEGPPGPPGTGGTWGSIVGTLSNQTDLQNALDAKQSVSGMSAYLTKAGNLTGLTDLAAARDNLQLGALYTPTFAGVTAQGSGANVANLTPTSLTLNQTGYGYFTIQPSQGIVFPDASVQTSAFTPSLLLPYAPLASPLFTGDPRGPTAALGDNDTSLATTAFVQQELASGTAVAKNLEVYVRNQTGSTLAAGAIVYINGATGNRPTVTLAQANNDANSAQTFGFVKTAIANNGFGYVIVRGELENVDTSALTEGVQLYLSPTTPGAWTTTKPSAPEHLVYVGIVVRAHPTQGVILVAVQNGYELNELHDVQISSPTNGQVLKYNASTGLWYNGTDVGGVAWGGITGTLSDQTDLQTALNLKLDSSTAASTYRALTNNTFGNIGITAGNALTIDDGGSPIGETVLQNAGLLIRDTSNVPLARFQYDQVLIPSVGITFSDATTQTTAGLSPATAASTYQTIAGMSSYLTTSAAASTYAALAGATFTGEVVLPASTTTTASLTIPHGAAPSAPVNGELWTTTGGLFVRINGATRQYVDLDGTQTINGAKTFSGSNQTLGNSTAAGTIAIGTGATISGATKTINIGTGGVAGSTTNINLGTTSGGGATITLSNNTTLNGNLTTTGTASHISNSTASQTLNLAAGATLSGSTKTVNIGTAGVAGSTTAIAIGSTTGTSTTTLQGTTNGVTLAADTNSTALATTAFVVGQAGSATPLVDGTAAVGTSLRYARQDHVHPTDTSRAPLASPALTGTPTAPTAIAGTNTTQIATTAFVQQEVPAASTTVAGKVELATAAEAITPISTTLATSPDAVREMLMYPGYIQMFGGGNVATSGTGAAATFTFATQRWHALASPNAAVAGYASYIGDYSFSGIGMGGMSRGTSAIARRWNSQIWASGRTILGEFAESTSGFNGDVNTTARVMVGGRSAVGTGGMVAGDPGIGWKVTGGGSQLLVLTVSNGTTLTEVNSSFTPVARQIFDWKIYSDGAGNVTLWVNDSQVATTTGGPTTATPENYNFYYEVVEQTASAATRLAMANFGTKIYWAP